MPIKYVFNGHLNESSVGISPMLSGRLFQAVGPAVYADTEKLHTARRYNTNSWKSNWTACNEIFSPIKAYHRIKVILFLVEIISYATSFSTNCTYCFCSFVDDRVIVTIKLFAYVLTYNPITMVIDANQRRCDASITIKYRATPRPPAGCKRWIFEFIYLAIFREMLFISLEPKLSVLNFID